jgi:hypothetical protein
VEVDLAGLVGPHTAKHDREQLGAAVAVEIDDLGRDGATRRGNRLDLERKRLVRKGAARREQRGEQDAARDQLPHLARE